MNDDRTAAEPATHAPAPTATPSHASSQAPSNYANTQIAPTHLPPAVTIEMHDAHPMPQAPAPATVIAPGQTHQTHQPQAAPTPPATPAEREPIKLPATPSPTTTTPPNDTATKVADPADDEPEDVTPARSSNGILEWTSEDEPHNYAAGRPVFFFIGVALITALVYWLTHGDLVSTISVGLAALALIFYNMRRPQTVHYQLDNRGITIDNKIYLYSQFRSYALVDEFASVGTVTLAPLQRFMPLLTISYAHELHDSIVDYLSRQLPMEARHGDAVDALIRKIRF